MTGRLLGYNPEKRLEESAFSSEDVCHCNTSVTKYANKIAAIITWPCLVSRSIRDIQSLIKIRWCLFLYASLFCCLAKCDI